MKEEGRKGINNRHTIVDALRPGCDGGMNVAG
jgi:hypothetical protein